MTTQLRDQPGSSESSVGVSGHETGTALLEVKPATAADQERLVATVVPAFSQDPVVRWFYHQPHQYLAHWPAFIKAFAGKAFEHAHYIGDYTGAALWLPPGVSPDEDTILPLIKQTQADLFAVLNQMGSYHPDGPHWYLPLIGVDTAMQHKGLGSALLKYALGLCDRVNQTAYLDPPTLPTSPSTSGMVSR